MSLNQKLLGRFVSLADTFKCRDLVSTKDLKPEVSTGRPTLSAAALWSEATSDLAQYASGAAAARDYLVRLSRPKQKSGISPTSRSDFLLCTLSSASARSQSSSGDPTGIPRCCHSQ